MAITSANIDDLNTFIDGSDSARGVVRTDHDTAKSTFDAVFPACSGGDGFQVPTTTSIAALRDLLDNWHDNQRFVTTVRDALVESDNYDADGNALVASAVVTAELRTEGLDEPPGPVDIAVTELVGPAPYSGYVDDPICLANGNFLYLDCDEAVFGIGECLSVGRAYNSCDVRDGVFGYGWSSLGDVSLDIDADRWVAFRGPDGGGGTFARRDDGTFPVNRRRRQSLERVEDGWILQDDHIRTWYFDADGVLERMTSRASDMTVERTDDTILFTEHTTGRWSRYTLDPSTGRATEITMSDGRTVTYDHDEHGRLVAVHRAGGDVTYGYDEDGFLDLVVDADGVTICRNVYDADGRVRSQVESHGRETSYEYGADGVSTVTAADGSPPNVMVHDRRGRMTAMIDGLGNAMRVAYDDDDNIVQVVDRTGATTRFAHDAAGNMVERTDPDGLSTRWEWDDLGRVVAETDRAGHTTRFAYDGDDRQPVLVTLPDGAQTRLTYDERGCPTSVVDADGVRAALEWNRDGQTVALVDGLGARVEFDHDRVGRTIAMTMPTGERRSVGVDHAGRMRTLRTGSGERHFEYSAAGRTIGGRHEWGTRWQAAIDTAGEVAEISDTSGLLVRLERDLVGQVVATTDAAGARTTFEFDPVGRRTATVDPEGNRTEVGYDAEGRMTSVTDPTGATASFAHDPLGRVQSVTDPRGGTSVRTLHPNGQPASVIDPGGREWRYDVDARGNVVSATDPAGHTTTYRYTPGGRLSEVRSPLGRVLRHEYDAAGRLARTVEPDGVEVVFERRADGRLSRVTRDGVPTTFGYDDAARPTSVAGPLADLAGERGPDGALTELSIRRAEPSRFDRDARGLLDSFVDPAGVVTEFSRDLAGHLVGHTTGDSAVSYAHDLTGRVVAATDPHGAQTTFERDPRGMVSRTVRPDGTGIARRFDPAGLLDAVTDLDGGLLCGVDRDSDGRVIAGRDEQFESLLERDVLGRITAVVTGAGTVGYEWDADGYLQGISTGDGFAASLERDDRGRHVAYDLADGRRIARPAPVAVERDDARRIVVDEHGRTFGYDSAGRLARSTVGDATTTYGYDDRGLLASERNADGTRTYRYGTAGELLRQHGEDGTERVFDHDAVGRRIRETSSDGSTVDYGWDDLGRLTSVTRTDASGHRETDHIDHDPLGRPLRINGTPLLWDSAVSGRIIGIGDQRFLWAGDQVLDLDDDEGSWSRRIGDDPWGADADDGLHLGYRGSLMLGDLVFLGDRVYDTSTRTFLTRDPVPSAPGALTFAGVYSYAWCDPVNRVDPTGRRPLTDEEYTEFVEQSAKSPLSRGLEALGDVDWKKFAAKALVVTASVVVMAAATAVLGPGGLIVAGALVGAVSEGTMAWIDGKPPGDIARAALVGGLVGGVTGPLGKFIPPSVGSTTTQRVASYLGLRAAQDYGSAALGEVGDSYIPIGDNDGRFDWGAVGANGTLNMVGGVAGDGIASRTIPDFGDDMDSALRNAFDGETPESLLPQPTWAGDGLLERVPTSELEALPGIGPVLAERVAEEASSRPIRTLADLESIHGIGPERAQAIFGLIGG